MISSSIKSYRTVWQVLFLAFQVVLKWHITYTLHNLAQSDKTSQYYMSHFCDQVRTKNDILFFESFNLQTQTMVKCSSEESSKSLLAVRDR